MYPLLSGEECGVCSGGVVSVVEGVVSVVGGVSVVIGVV